MSASSSNMRIIESRVDISYGNEEIADALEYTCGNANAVSKFENLYNNNHTPQQGLRTFTLEGNASNSLGTGRRLIEPEIVGWWSSSLSSQTASASGGYPFTDAPQMTVNFGKARPIKTLELFGDPELAEYPIKFTIKLYSTADSVKSMVYDRTFLNNDSFSTIEEKKILRRVDLLAKAATETETETETDNMSGSPAYEADSDYITGITELVVEILEWNKPKCLSKIYRCYDDILERYTQDELKSFECVHELANTNEIKFGLVSGSCAVTLLNNKNRKFDLGYLKNLAHINKRVMPYVNGEKLGTYFIKEWDISQDNMFVSCKANDRLLDLQDFRYEGCMPQTAGETKTFGELFEKVLSFANGFMVKKFSYNIDSRLDEAINVIGSNGNAVDINAIEPYLPRESVWSVLQMLCDASMSFVYVDKYDTICVKSELPDDESETDSGIEIDTGNAFGISIPFFADMTANSVEIPYFKKTVKSGEQLYKIEGVSAIAGQQLQFVVEFDDFCEIEEVKFSDYEFSIAPIKINDFTYSISFATQKDASNATLTVTGSKIAFEKQNLHDKNETSINESAMSLYVHPDCKLLQNENMAKRTAKRIMDIYYAGTKSASSTWRGNERLNLFDKYKITDRFGSEAKYRAAYIKNTVDGGFRQEVKGVLKLE